MTIFVETCGLAVRLSLTTNLYHSGIQTVGRKCLLLNRSFLLNRFLILTGAALYAKCNLQRRGTLETLINIRNTVLYNFFTFSDDGYEFIKCLSDHTSATHR